MPLHIAALGIRGSQIPANILQTVMHDYHKKKLVFKKKIRNSILSILVLKVEWGGMSISTILGEYDIPLNHQRGQHQTSASVA